MRDDIWHNEGMVFKPELLQEHCMTVPAQIYQFDKYLSQVLKNMQNADGFLRRKKHLMKVALRNITAFEKKWDSTEHREMGNE